MSNHLAIATVTGALNYRLSQLVQVEMPSAQVTNLRPNAPSGLPTTGINIFLYQVTPNVAQRNSDLPTRRSDGALLKRPVAALDLHYMLSFYGDETAWEPQLLLGTVVRSMHAQPLLDVATITAMLGDPSALYAPLHPTNLQEALEPVRFTPTSLTFEEMSKLWGIFYQIPYVLSVAYGASVVLIDSDAVPRTTLPVKSFQVGAVPLENPIIARAFSLANPTLPLLPADQLVLEGTALLGGTSRVVLVDGAAATVTSATAQRYVVDLPAGITAGVHVVRLVETVAVTPSFSSVVESNLKTFAVAPAVTSASATKTTTPAATTVEITALVTPSLGPEQRLHIALARVGGGEGYFLDAEVGATADRAVAKTTATITAGNYLIRVFVDGVPSALSGTPFSAPAVSIP